MEEEDQIFREMQQALDRDVEGDRLLAAVQEPDEPIFRVQIEPCYETHSRVHGVRERVFVVTLNQMRDPDDAIDLLRSMVVTIGAAWDALLNRVNILDRDHIYFQLASNRMPNAYAAWGLTAGEWRDGSHRAQRIMDNMGDHLNSNENFEYHDTFHLSMVHVASLHFGGGRTSGGGKKTRAFIPGKTSFRCLRSAKKCIIQIPKDLEDNICCALAIIVA